MKIFALAALVLTALQAQTLAPPARPLDDKNPQSVAEHAAYNTRTQKSYETKFTAQLIVPGSDPLNYAGECVWVSPGVLFVHYIVTGGDDKKIVRAGNTVWVWHSLAGWVLAEELGISGAGRGIQNPDEILAVLARHTGTATLAQPGVVEMNLSGDDIERIMKDQASRDAFVWKESKASLQLTVDAQNRLQKFVCSASLKSANPQVTGIVRYSAQVDLVAFNQSAALKFHDEKKREIPLTKEIQTAVDRVLKEKK
jgi:hypothetical protein